MSDLRDPTSPLFDGVNVMGLEIDVPETPTKLPLPAVFLELNHDVAADDERLVTIARELLAHQLSPATAAMVRRIVDLLPPGSMPFQLGAMLSRPGGGLRVVVSDVPANRICGYLGQVGWTGDDHSLPEIVTALSPVVESFALSMDVAERVHSRIGLECYVSAGPRFARGWRLLLARLQRLGFCTRAKAQALLAWSGVCQGTTCRAQWPRHLGWGDRLLAPRATSVIARTLGHVKLVVQPAAAVEAKAYLGFAHYWLERRPPRDRAMP